eukprot:639857-Rhodomonas_salina.4
MPVVRAGMRSWIALCRASKASPNLCSRGQKEKGLDDQRRASAGRGGCEREAWGCVASYSPCFSWNWLRA